MNIFEKIGKIHFSLPWTVGIISLPFLVVAASLIFCFFQKNALIHQENEWVYLHQLAAQTLSQRLEKKEKALQYKEVDLSHLTDSFKKLSLNIAEKNHLNELLHHPAFCQQKNLQKRLQFLTHANACQLFLSNESENNQVIEQLFTLKERIELDPRDIDTFLSSVEEDAANKPYARFKEIQIHKTPQNKYVLDAKIIQRIFK
jgi:hypothetical protein